jgi:tRNA G10  N-methylase Trm11
MLAAKNIAVKLGFALLPVLFTFGAKAQTRDLDTLRVYAIIDTNGDTIPYSILPPVSVFTQLTREQKKYWAEWTRLRNAVYVTYPYAIAASKIMNEINVKLVNVDNRKERRKIIHAREKELKREFTDKLTKLSVYQGKVLMKLINRQTGNNCYEIIEEYKGFMSAAFWQGVAFVFGSNLKQAYDASGKDRDMERIVRDVQLMYGHSE